MNLALGEHILNKHFDKIKNFSGYFIALPHCTDPPSDGMATILGFKWSPFFFLGGLPFLILLCAHVKWLSPKMSIFWQPINLL